MAKKSNKISFIVLLLIIVLCLGSCGKTVTVTEIPLGEGLPAWKLDEVHTVKEITGDDREQGLIGIYTTDTDKADVYVYSFTKEDGASLEDFGQQQAAKRNVFCNMLTDQDLPVAVLNYHDSIKDEHYIVQAYIYETNENFIEVCTLFKTAPVAFDFGDLTIRMIREYDAQVKSDSPLHFDTVYTSENDKLPVVNIRMFPKADFSADVIEPGLLNTVSDDRLSVLAEDGWTPEELITLYGEGYNILRGEVMRRNDLDLAFIGYIDNGTFKTRAFIEDGNDYVMLCAQAEASKFQHVTNALIDAIEKN